MGIPLQGLLHDLSKYSIKELSQYKYYTGKKSPHVTMREQIGYSTSWYHHRNRNKHHWEYWIDSLEDKTAVEMPYKYVIEMLCDMAGAGYAYNKESWQPADVLKYWSAHKGSHRIIHPKTEALFAHLLNTLATFDNFEDFAKFYRRNKKVFIEWYNML